MAGTGARRAAISTAVLGIALTAWCFAAVQQNSVAPGVVAALPTAARALAAGLFLVAGTARLAWARLTGDDWGMRRGLVLLVMGVTLPVATVVDWGLHDGPVVALDPIGRLIVVVPAIVTIVSAEFVIRRPTWRQVWRVAAGLVIATTALAALIRLLTGPPQQGQHVEFVWYYLEVAAATAWGAVALQLWRGRKHSVGSLHWAALAMVMMLVCEGIKAGTVLRPGPAGNLSAGFQLAAGALALMAAASDAIAAFKAESGRSRELTSALRSTQRELKRLEQQDRERLHDARSAVLGVMGASELLAEPTSPIAEPAQLHRLMREELDRLRAILERDSGEPIERFSLVDVLQPIVIAQQLAGLTVHTDLGDACASGRPRTFATAVDNLLTNARVHAPGSTVELRALTVDDAVVVTVDDDGPGIPRAEHQYVLRAGARGSTARGAGSGLGLHSAASGLAGMGGSLRITGRPGGGTRATVMLSAVAPVAYHTPVAVG